MTNDSREIFYWYLLLTLKINQITFRVQSDKEIIEYLRGYAETCYHPTSSCRIGADDFSVCDSDFKVKEIIG